jgi:DNA-binding transcriptional regulator YdaS (Cro superfamily)
MPTPFERAVARIGGPQATAQRLSVSRQRVSAALKGNPDRCPDGWALTLSELSGIPRSHLRPDVYPPRRKRTQ